MMLRHTRVAESTPPQRLQQQAVEMIAAHTLSCGQTVKTVLRKLQAAPAALQNKEFLLLAKTLQEVGLYPFVDDISGHYAATVVDAQPWASLLPNVIEGFEVHNLVGLKIT